MIRVDEIHFSAVRVDVGYGIWDPIGYGIWDTTALAEKKLYCGIVTKSSGNDQHIQQQEEETTFGAVPVVVYFVAYYLGPCHKKVIKKHATKH